MVSTGQQIQHRGETLLQRALWGVLVLVLTGVIGAGAWSLGGKGADVAGVVAFRSPRLPVYGSVPDFSLVERSDRLVERSEFLGKIWIINFIYTSCRDSCALQTAVMASIQADSTIEPDVCLVSITVDPEHDTAPVLRRYADRFRADRTRWLFLTGKREAIYRFAYDGLLLPVGATTSGARVPESDEMLPSGPPRRHAHLHAGPDGLLGPAPAIADGGATTILHSAKLVLVDRTGRIRRYYDGTDMAARQRLRQDVKALRLEG